MAVEAIKIKLKKGFLGKMEWEFKKIAEMIFRSRLPGLEALAYRSQTQKSPEANPLNELKLRLARGEITMKQYLEMEEIFTSR